MNRRTSFACLLAVSLHYAPVPALGRTIPAADPRDRDHEPRRHQRHLLRALADPLHQRLGQPLVIENRPGGNMIIGARACADAPPDGYTLCVMPGEPLTYNQFQFKSIPYDRTRALRRSATSSSSPRRSV